MPVARRELKYEIPAHEAPVLARRLGMLFPRDEHAGPDGRYTVLSAGAADSVEPFSWPQPEKRARHITSAIASARYFFMLSSCEYPFLYKKPVPTCWSGPV